MLIIGILIGMFIGANLGVLIMALCQVSGKNAVEKEVKDERELTMPNLFRR